MLLEDGRKEEAQNVYETVQERGTERLKNRFVAVGLIDRVR